MSKAFDTAYDKIVSSEWTKDQAVNYLHVQAINGKIQEKIWKAANHNALWEDYLSKKKTEDQLVKELGGEVFETLKTTGKLPIEKPSTWDRDQPLSLNIDVIMHLLFLGVWSTIVSVGMDWLRMNKMEPSFLQYTDGLLEKIQGLNLSYCKVLPYKKGKLGGWVSENYLGLARVAGWFYAHFGATKKEDPYVEPTKDQWRWTKKENEAWLSVRGLDKKGDAKTLRSRVEEIMNRDGGPPPVVESGGGSRDLFLNAVNGILRVICVVMQDFMNDELLLEMEFQIKLFLTLFDDLDEKMREPDDKPKLITTYNFFSLLNLPVASGMLGPLRNVWEGGPMGEGYLQQIKGALNTGLKPGWEMRLMNTIHKNCGLRNVLKNWKGTEADLDLEEEETVKPGLYHKYKSIATLVTGFEQGNPISCLRFKSGQFGCIVGDSLEVIEIVMNLAKKKEMLNDMAYITWEIEKKDILGKLPKMEVDHAVLLLPLLSENGTPKEDCRGVYTAVTDTWAKISLGGHFLRY